MRVLDKYFVTEFKKGGFFSPIVETVINDTTLDFEIRDGYVNIYFKGNSILKLNENGTYEFIVAPGNLTIYGIKTGYNLHSTNSPSAIGNSPFIGPSSSNSLSSKLSNNSKVVLGVSSTILVKDSSASPPLKRILHKHQYLTRVAP